MPAQRIPLLLAASMAVLAGGQAKPSVPAFDRNEVLGSIRRLERSPSPEARAIVRQIENGRQDLALQRAAARREGIPLTPAQLEAAIPPPALDAAPLYKKLARILKAKPLDARVLRIAGRLGASAAATSEERTAVREMLRKQQDALALIHRATDRPCCAFKADWSPGLQRLFGEFSTLRVAARLLQAESFSRAEEGRWREAITTQARGFRIAQHAATDSFLVGYLIGNAFDRMALIGMQNILYRAGPNAEVAARVGDAIAASRPRFSFRRALETEGVFSLGNMEELRRGGPQKLAEWLSKNVDLEVDNNPHKAVAKARKPTPAEQRLWNELIDAAEASSIRTRRRLLARVNAPYHTRAALLEEWNDRDKAQPNNPICRLDGDEFDILEGADTQGVRQRAREDVVMAGAALLVYRARHGAFPDHLEETIPEPPLDPFSGRPLRYRREGDGFVVFSVGSDGTFDGGEPGRKIDSQEAYFRYPAPVAGSAPGSPPS